MIENAQRSKNPISDYNDIQAILRAGAEVSYKSIAAEVGVPITYVKTLDETYGRVPQWAMEGALADQIAETVIKEVGKLSKELQGEAKKYFKEKKALPMSYIDELKRFKREEFSVSFSQAPGIVFNTGRDFIPATELQQVKDMLEKKDYKGALATLTQILS
jgi:hypothetical protein